MNTILIAICQKIESYRRVNIQADLPGSGKTFITRFMTQLGHKVLTISPTNSLVLDSILNENKNIKTMMMILK
jgi:tRNA A37 threonylcarbamoyladenosine biosynthesis protein TsaE